LSTLYLSGILEGTNANGNAIEQGIHLKLKFLESDFVKDFKALATDETYKTTKKELQLLFLNQLQIEIDKTNSITISQFIEIISKQSFSAKEDFLKNFVQKPIEQIEKKITETQKRRKDNKANCGKYGNELYNETKSIIKNLTLILPSSDLKLVSVSDKLANEILQCSIEYFNHFHETETEVGEEALALNIKAKSIALGGVVKERIDESTSIVGKHIEDKPERQKQKEIADDLQFITSKLERFHNLSNSIANAKDLVDICKPKLMNVKNTLGSTDDFYLKICSAVVNNAQGMLVAVVNEAQEGFKNYQSLGGLRTPDFYMDSQGKMQFKQSKSISLSELSTIVNSAYDVTTSMQSIDMIYDLKQQFQKNRETLAGIKNQINSATRTSSSSSGSGGCYIATMAYGDYDHPQVIILRQFRDNVLDRSSLGKWFIKTYYHYSPKLVERLKNRRLINDIIRRVLNQFIKIIK